MTTSPELQKHSRSSPKITVLVPCYNVEKYIEECLWSIHNQTYPHLEILCINDGSTDNTLEILKKFECVDSRIRIINKANSGYGASMNIGLNQATGDYIGIVESDDFIEPVMFELLIKQAIEHDLDIVRACYFQFRTSDGSNELIKNDFVPKNEIFCPIKNQSPFYQAPAIWAAIYRRGMLNDNNIRFLETPGASFQDTSFAFKAYCCAKRFLMIDDGVLHYRIDNENSSVNNPEKVFCVCDEYEEMWKFAQANPDLYRAVKNLIPVLQVATYTWNYNRLSSSLRKLFLEKWSAELRNQLENNLLILKKYRLKKRVQLLRIAYMTFSIRTSKNV